MSEHTSAQDGAIKSIYETRKTERQPYLMRARECAKYTIPSLLPEEGANGSTKLYSPYQSIGARGTNALAAKLLLTLLPPNSPFFRYVISDAVMAELTGKNDVRGQIEEALSGMENEIMSEVETSAMRPPVFEALKQLIVAGNALVHLPDSGRVKIFRLDRFVVKRDPMGNLLEVITHEDLAEDQVPEDMKAVLAETNKAEDSPGASDKTIPLYTRAYLEDGQWVVEQELGGHTVPGTRYTRPKDRLPYLALRFIAVSGEDYGRSYVEEYIGDLKSYEGLSKAIVQGAAAAAKVLFLVRPNSTTSMKTLAKSESGDIREGNKDDVSVLQMEKYADFRVAKETIESLKESLAFAFLLNTAIQRNGERVTAEEIRYMANELESALGGIYSNLAQDFQMPLLNLLEARLVKQKRIPKLPGVKPVAVTGVEAIGRGQDRVKLIGFIQDVTSTIGPEAAAQHLLVSELLSRLGASWSINMKGLIKSPEQLQAEQQQAQQMQMMQQLGPNAVNALGGMAKQHMANQGAGAEQAPPPPPETA